MNIFGIERFIRVSSYIFDFKLLSIDDNVLELKVFVFQKFDEDEKNKLFYDEN